MNFSPNLSPPLTTEKREKNTYEILLIEDNYELAEFVAMNLPEYKFIHAVNGSDGIQKALNAMPGLIIIDATIPIKNGYQCCHKLKQHPQTNHIPVILLTQQIEDSKKDPIAIADDYIEKPFRISDLHLKIVNLLRKYTYVQGQLHKNVSNFLSKSGLLQASSSSNTLLDKVYEILEKKIEDASFNVEDLANHLYMSKANLHRKLIKLTGLAPGRIIYNYRLQRAAQYLKEGCSSSKTAYNTGFDSPAYFSKCFKEFYGVTPLKFSQQ